jgi:hypothetical protein
MISDSIRRQTSQIFENIEILLNSFSDSEFPKKSGGFAIWKQFYHLIHSMDKNFIDPSNFQEPSFHIDNLDIIYLDSEIILSKEQIIEYYSQVKLKIQEYLEKLTDAHLLESIEFRELRLTRIELILAQLRHIFYHVGYFHCIKKVESGQTPEYVGLYKTLEKRAR